MIVLIVCLLVHVSLVSAVRKDLKLQKIYTGSLRITNQDFVDAYENPDSAEFKNLANQVMDQVRTKLKLICFFIVTIVKSVFNLDFFIHI